MRVYVVEVLTNTDITMDQTLRVGLYPGLNNVHLDFTVQKLEEFFGVNF
jgi:CDP-6-deoxy-D-xylo-4-hexulose-3-dehydrase